MTHEMTIEAALPVARQERFGLGNDRGSAHMARTMMLANCAVVGLGPIIICIADAYVEPSSKTTARERSSRTRALTKRHLEDLYSLSPETALFRALRYFGNAILRASFACLPKRLCEGSALENNNPIHRETPAGHAFSTNAMEDFLESRFPDVSARRPLGRLYGTLRPPGLSPPPHGTRQKSTRQCNCDAWLNGLCPLSWFLSGERGEALSARITSRC